MKNTATIALSRQAAMWRQMEVISNNMANANTTAYKGEQMMFREFMVKSPSANGKSDSLSFVQDVSVLRQTGQGALASTDNPLDVAINGEGYFAIDTAQGQRFTRNGHFKLDQAGQMVTANNEPVMDASDRPFFFTASDTNISIARDGTVSSDNGKIGKIRVVTFENQQSLQKVGNGLYSSEQAPLDAVSTDLVQGSVEESNVQPITEMSHMVQIMHNYEAAQGLIEKEHQRELSTIQTLSKVA